MTWSLFLSQPEYHRRQNIAHSYFQMGPQIQQNAAIAILLTSQSAQPVNTQECFQPATDLTEGYGPHGIKAHRESWARDVQLSSTSFAVLASLDPNHFKLCRR